MELFKFVAISGDVGSLRTKTYKNPNRVVFSPETDIIDSTSILNDIKALPIDQLFVIYEFFKDELGSPPDILKFDSTIAE